MDYLGTWPIDPTVPILGGLALIDVHLPAYDVALTQHLVVAADPSVVFAAARDFDFLTTDAPLVTALMTARTLPGLLRRRPTAAPAALMLRTSTTITGVTSRPRPAQQEGARRLNGQARPMLPTSSLALPRPASDA